MPSPQESDPYCLENVPLDEALYGKHLISLGGTAAIDSMFSDLTLTKLKALDLGFGLGGVAYYLAEKYQMNIAGVEIYDWMETYAKNNAPQSVAHLLEFKVYDADGKIPYPVESFDMVYSKGVLNHVREKTALFKQINAVLKQDGIFVIADWIYSEKKEDDGGPLVYETQQSYTDALQNAGFKTIHFRNDSNAFNTYVQLFLNNLHSQHDFIEKKFGSELFEIILKQHQNLLDEINQKHKLAMRIVAKK